MTNPEKPTNDKYDYFRDLPLAAVEAHFASLTERIDVVKSRYSGPLGQQLRRMNDTDQAELADILGDLLPMGLNTAVQAELIAALVFFLRSHLYICKYMSSTNLPAHI